MSGKSKSVIKALNHKEFFVGLINEEQTTKYFSSLVKQMLHINKSYNSSSGGYRVATNNIGYKEVKAYLDTLILKKLPDLLDKSLEKHVVKLSKHQLDNFTLNASTRKKINDKFEDMLLQYLEDLPEKERSKLMMKYLMCRK